MNALADLLLGVSTLLMCFNESSRASWNSNKIPIFYRSSRPEVFYKKGVLRNFVNFTGKHLCQSLFFNKVAGLRPATLLKNRLWHRCFPVNFAKFLRTLFFTEYLQWLLLFLDFFFISLCVLLCNSKLFFMTVTMIFRIEQYDNCS